MRRWTVFFLLASGVVFGGGGRGQGAIVNREGAPVYKGLKGDEIAIALPRGKAVAGTTMGLQPLWQFDEKEGRVRIVYFKNPDDKGMSSTGWMEPKDLARFTYDGSCEDFASPFAVKGLSQRWNACFQEARDAKLEELRAKWETEAQPKAEPPTHPRP